MTEDVNERMTSHTRRRVLQLTGGLGAAAVGGVSPTAASSTLDIAFSDRGWGTTHTDDDNVVSTQYIRVEFSDEVTFGPDNDRGFRITNVDTGATLRFTAAEQFTVPAFRRIGFSDFYGPDGTILDEPRLSNDTQRHQVDIEGDDAVFTDGPIFSTYTIEIIENLDDPEPVATTAEAIRAVSLERPPIEQDSTSGEIELQLELPEALDESWFVEFSPSAFADAGFEFEATEIPNHGTDTLSWTTDFSQSESGSYDGWQIYIYPDEETTSDSDIIGSTTGFFAIDADHITIDTDEPDEPAEEHESGVDQDVFDAVDQSGDGELTLDELVEANIERLAEPRGEVDGVEVTLDELVELNIWRLSA